MSSYYEERLPAAHNWHCTRYRKIQESAVETSPLNMEAMVLNPEDPAEAHHDLAKQGDNNVRVTDRNSSRQMTGLVRIQSKLCKKLSLMPHVE